jgi:4-amino-4-deoxy-L-arabinose transferase-like glycosyltransferase
MQEAGGKMQEAGGKMQEAGSKRQETSIASRILHRASRISHRASCIPHLASRILLAVFIGLGLNYSFVTPLFEGPDETGHYAYVAQLVRGHGLPIQSLEPANNATYEGHQPPLYYVLGALINAGADLSNETAVLRPNPAFIWGGQGREPNAVLHTAAEQFPWSGAARVLHLARLVSVLLGAVTVWSAYRLGQIITRREAVALGAAAVVAFNPQFLFISSLVNNDSAVIAFSSLALVVMASIGVEGTTRRRALWLGVWLGLALLSKLSALMLVAPVFWVALLVARRERTWRAGGRLLLWLSLPFAIIAGWWLVRNQILYGDPLGYGMFLSSVSSLQAAADLSRPEVWRSFVEQTHESFWGLFGWMVISLPKGVNAALTLLLPSAVIGALVGWLWRRELKTVRRIGGGRWMLLIITVLAFVLWTINFARTNGGSAFQGRYLFPAIAAIAVLLVAGLSAIVPDRFRWIPIAGAIVPLAALAISVPGSYLAPAYRYLTVPESTLSVASHRLNGTFSPEISLAGFRTEPAAAYVDVTLYWKAQGTPPAEYKVFIHAVNADGALCGQQDGLTQAGVFPMAFWQAGDVIEDPQRVPIDPECCGVKGCDLHIGLYREDTGERLLYSLNGQPVSDHVEIRP